MAKNVWNGIDVEFVADPQGIKTNYHVQPFADPSQILIEYEGLDAPLLVDGSGNLVLATSLGELIEQKPLGWQKDNSVQTDVQVCFRSISNETYSLVLGAYNPDKKFTIDPLLYSTYFGSGTGATGLCLDLEGHIVISGSTLDDNFPITPGSYRDTPIWMHDCFISMFSANGDFLLFSTYIGGSDEDWETELVADNQGNIVIAANTESHDWPRTSGAFDSIFGGDYEVALSHISMDGANLLYSTYIGGPISEFVECMRYDSVNDEMYVMGYANTGNLFPTTPDAMARSSPGSPGFVTIYDTRDQQVTYSTLFPTRVENTRVNIRSGYLTGYRQLWVAGECDSGLIVTESAFQPNFGGHSDAYVSHLNLSDGIIGYSSFLGGMDWDFASTVTVSDSGVFVGGSTLSLNFPTTQGVIDTVGGPAGFWEWFISRIEPSSGLIASSLLGGMYHDYVDFISAGDASGILVVGSTGSPDFPLSADTTDPALGSGNAVIARLSFDLTSPIYSTRFGASAGVGVQAMVNPDPNTLWLSGVVGDSGELPLTDNAYQRTSQGWLSNFVTGITIQGTSVNRDRYGPDRHNVITTYPNPTNAGVNMRFDLTLPAPATVRAFNLLGRMVEHQDLGFLSAGPHSVELHAIGWPSGVYYIELELGTEVVTVKSVLLR
ncbi:T9SS type A sorting domain-containing protein [candidate division KSB1 bacterium]|nr:T9SS type A sorting domain-containing protein [candidate division KSB1 bacterium]